MSENAAVKPVNDEVKATEALAPVVEKPEEVAAEAAAPAAAKPAATAAAVEKIATKTKAVPAKPARKLAADKPATAPKAALAKPVKKDALAAKKKVLETLKAEKAEKECKAKKQAPKKPKLVRDSFTIPETDYALFATLKQRALAAGVEVKKSEILRAAILALAKLDDAELVKAIGLVERIKTGRPKK
jgi:hypothetical protein